MASLVPTITLNDGSKIPMLGLGTWKSKPGEVEAAVKIAIDVGYRHIDCAHIYGNEKEVGSAIKEKIDEGIVKRNDLWITSKLWHTFHSPNLVEPAIRTTLKNLGLDYLDLYLIHGPMGYQEGGELFPKTDDKVLYSDVDYVDTWKAMEELQKKGLTKTIGVSNFNSEQIDRVLKVANIKPVTNQVECHPYLNQKKLAEFCKERKIVLTAYSPFASPDRPWAKPGEPLILEDPTILTISKIRRKTPAQILLRYQIENGNIPIPKSVTPIRIQENFEIFDFKLSSNDMQIIDKLNRNGRVCCSTPTVDHKYYPYNIPF